MNLKTYLLCIMLLGLGLNLQGMKRVRKKPVVVDRQAQIKVEQLKEAIKKSNPDQVNLLLQEIKDPLPQDILFSLNGDTEKDGVIFDALIAHVGTDSKTLINFQNPNLQGMTIVHVAVGRGWINMLKRLIAAGATVMVKSFKEDTPLTLAVARYCLLCKSTNAVLKNGAQEIIELLKKNVVLSIGEYVRQVQSIVVKD